MLLIRSTVASPGQVTTCPYHHFSRTDALYRYAAACLYGCATISKDSDYIYCEAGAPMLPQDRSQPVPTIVFPELILCTDTPRRVFTDVPRLQRIHIIYTVKQDRPYFPRTGRDLSLPLFNQTDTLYRHAAACLRACQQRDISFSN